MPTAIAIGNMFGGNASGSGGGTPIPPPPSGGFKMTVNTALTGTSANDEFKLTLYSGDTYSFDIDWGDGTTDTITAWNQAELLHTYSVAGIYLLEITGTCGNIKYSGSGDILKITDISNWGGSNLNIGGGGAAFAFRGYAGTITATDSPTISGDLVGYFYQSTFSSGCSNWNTANAASFQFFFLSNSNWNDDISSWNVGSATTFSNAFGSAPVSTANYDALLIAWSAQTVNVGVSLTMGSTQYTLGGAAEAGRATLVTKGWSITDGGGI
jgi:hypothetical protein